LCSWCRWNISLQKKTRGSELIFSIESTVLFALLFTPEKEGNHWERHTGRKSREKDKDVASRKGNQWTLQSLILGHVSERLESLVMRNLWYWIVQGLWRLTFGVNNNSESGKRGKAYRWCQKKASLKKLPVERLEIFSTRFHCHHLSVFAFLYFRKTEPHLSG
jgi:hypothetical protein